MSEGSNRIVAAAESSMIAIMKILRLPVPLPEAAHEMDGEVNGQSQGEGGKDGDGHVEVLPDEPHHSVDEDDGEKQGKKADDPPPEGSVGQNQKYEDERAGRDKTREHSPQDLVVPHHVEISDPSRPDLDPGEGIHPEIAPDLFEEGLRVHGVP